MVQYSKEKIAEWQLWNRVLTGLIKRCREKSKDYLEDLDEEMKSIISNNECQKYLDIADKKVETGESAVKPLVAYCLEITDILPA